MFTFRPRLVPTLFTLAGLGVLLSLGTWQLGRRADAAAELARYQDRIAEPPFDARTPPADPEIRRAWAEGVPDWDRRLYVHGRYMWMQIGLQVLVPLRLADGQQIIVDVGWVPSDEAEFVVANERAVPGVRRYEGFARPAREGTDPQGGFAPVDGYQRDWRAADPVAMAQALGFEGPAWILVDGDGLALEADIPDRVPPISGWRTQPETRPHAEYAFTWFSLALSLVLVWFSASSRWVAGRGGMG